MIPILFNIKAIFFVLKTNSFNLLHNIFSEFYKVSVKAHILIYLYNLQPFSTSGFQAN